MDAGVTRQMCRLGVLCRARSEFPDVAVVGLFRPHSFLGDVWWGGGFCLKSVKIMVLLVQSSFSLNVGGHLLARGAVKIHKMP